MLTNREPRSSCKCIWLFDFPVRDQMQIIHKKLIREAQSFVPWEIQRQTLNKIVILLKWAAEHIQLIVKIEFLNWSFFNLSGREWKMIYNICSVLGSGCLVVTVANISSKSQFMRNGRIPCLKDAIFLWLWLNSITISYIALLSIWND